MKGHNVTKFICIMLAVLVITMSGIAAFAQNTSSSNRFNVMVVLDASRSMKFTDKQEYRYEAISLFIGLLAEKGNVVGGLVFNTKIQKTIEPKEFTCAQDKEDIINMFKSVPPEGYTNTGAALAEATNLLNKYGKPELKDVILYLSDGNTEMRNDKETQQSLDQKADAIQTARNEGIAVYTVCLNQNGKADLSEMQQISEATGGEAQEVNEPEDLQKAFLKFYDLIYGTSTVLVEDGVFPQNGRIDTKFDVPGFGVEEVNIIIYGKTTNIELLNPNGGLANPQIQENDTFTLIKLTESISPGEWLLVTTGKPGDPIKINLVYNTALETELSIVPDPAAAVYTPNDEMTFSAVLKAGNETADTEAQYYGYSAKLHILDAYENEIETVDMVLNGSRFEVKKQFDDGVYKYYAEVYGKYINTESEISGPLTIQTPPAPGPSSAPPPPPPPLNTPPEPVKDKIEKTVYIIPFKKNVYTVDLSTLATDKEDSSLYYEIISSSFMEGKDYHVDGDVLTLDHFSISKGAFTVRATDSGGLSCKIEIIVKTVLVSIILIVILAIIGLIILAFIIYAIARRPAFKGAMTVSNILNSSDTARTHASFKKKVKLSYFGVGNCGFNQSKCYFVPVSKTQVRFCSDRPMYTEGGSPIKNKKLTLYLGENRIYADPEQERGICVNVEIDQQF